MNPDPLFTDEEPWALPEPETPRDRRRLVALLTLLVLVVVAGLAWHGR